MAVTATRQDRARANIDEQYTWNLSDLYPSIEAWLASRATVAAEVPGLASHAGTLGSSPQALADVLDAVMRLDKELARLYVYASMLGDQDTRDSGPQGMQQEMQQLVADFGAHTAYIRPEILRIDRATIERFIGSEPRLAVYRFYLDNIVRRASHTLTDAEERILASAGPLAGSASNIFGILANADFPYPTVTLHDGSYAKVDQSGYAELRARPNRADRETAMSAFFGSLGSFGRTFGTTMNASVQRALFYARARKYSSNLEQILDEPNIPTSVYMRLIDGVNRHLPTFHRYLRFRARMLGIPDTLQYYDLYAPLVASVEQTFSPDETKRHVLAAVAPLGDDYASVVTRSFTERWIDLYPNDGKRSGAYSNGAAYDVHPYMLLNYLGQYNDVSTLAHELGHTMHSYYSNATQPYVNADYPTFVAEVASTFNEALLIDHMLKHIEDEPTRMSMLGHYLEGIKATVFRQTQFAEFELRVHEMGQRGEAITGDALAKLYLEIVRRYYGHDEGVCLVPDFVAHEWSYIPHFYHEFYVFQYATSFTAAEALAVKVLGGDSEATARYLRFLSTGGSKYPIDILKEAGVDMTTDEPLDLTIDKMNRVMDEMEASPAIAGQETVR